MGEVPVKDPICKHVPNLISSFVETFVDFSVSGIFLPPVPLKNANSYLENPLRSPNSPSPSHIQTRYPSPERLIAVGDIHGDLAKFKQSLHIAGLIDATDRWSGGTSTVVQVGDVLDRGGDELKIFYFLEKLKRQADKSGGKIITMNGNHEIMNVYGDFRYVTREALREFEDWGFWYCVGNSMKGLCAGLSSNVRDIFDGVPYEFKGIKKEFHDGFRARIAALQPEGPICTRFLSDNATVLVMGDNVFVHGGLLLKHVVYGLEKINEEVRAWMKGVRKELWRDIGRGRDSIVWSRKYSDELAENCDCELLEHVLSTIPGARRMIMGHTIQQDGINAVCGNKAIRIDVGMSKGCINGLVEVLEINKNSGLRVLTSNPAFKEKYEALSQAGNKNGLGILLSEEKPRSVQVRA